jgi:hypothetical protein
MTSQDIEIIKYKTPLKLHNIIADGFIVYKTNTVKMAFVEVERCKNFNIKKYEDLYYSRAWRSNFEQFPGIIVISDKKVNTNNKFDSYTLTENLQADYLSKNDAADTYLPISALDETVANSISDYVNSEEMKSLLVTKNEFNQYSNEVSNSFGDIDSNITTIENDISNLKKEDNDINDKISYINTNRSMQELRHSYNASSKTHTLNFILSNGILGRDLEPSQYKSTESILTCSSPSYIKGYLVPIIILSEGREYKFIFLLVSSHQIKAEVSL